MNFSAHSAPTRPAIELRSLRRSLNTPVLSIAELPVGPGSAAIAAHADSRDGQLHYTLAVRCERSREVVFFCPREEDLRLSDASLAGEAALSLAEGMGFLFEEDLPAISGEAAASVWEEFVAAANRGAAGADVHTAALLTKFRRAHSGATGRSPATDARRSEAGSRRALRGFGAGLETPEGQLAHRGDR